MTDGIYEVSDGVMVVVDGLKFVFHDRDKLKDLLDMNCDEFKGG